MNAEEITNFENSVDIQSIDVITADEDNHVYIRVVDEETSTTIQLTLTEAIDFIECLELAVHKNMMNGGF